MDDIKTERKERMEGDRKNRNKEGREKTNERMKES